MSITIKDVAKKAGVSISTVSRVINSSKPVSSEIRQKVLKIIEDTGYQPNPIARSLVMKKSQLIGVVVPDISNFFIGEILNGIEEIGKMYGYDILLCNTYGQLEQELRYLNLLQAKQVEGIVFMTWKLQDQLVEYIEKIDTPVVLINRNTSKLLIPSVSIDNFQAAYEMTKYIFDNGHKKIALIRNSLDQDAFGFDQFRGYQKALEENGLEIDDNLVRYGNFKLENSYEIVKEFIQKDILPTAIFATSDVMAIGAINCLLDNGYEVPGDVSVVGFNDIKLASIYRPNLTTIHQPIYDIGAVSIRIIVKMINKEELDSNVVILPHELVERDSSKKIK
ncbi:LacI family DNA-binding transcriptional regulator [Marinisporobacter balticus]|uniref:LacI family transcriptional regulator n=1 Tax=Marinisporobacter balticus TaxID=2018667 RepID=A0A4R2L191_9FIRM|nr:LacI family DNA-binding transcriptional regulator [Marinisporobacter balticus]TCO79362.1 LacI family transcriptional regulator [Marinisporobacter balticus]